MFPETSMNDLISHFSNHSLEIPTVILREIVRYVPKNKDISESQSIEMERIQKEFNDITTLPKCARCINSQNNLLQRFVDQRLNPS